MEDLPAARLALREAAGRTAALITSVGNMDGPVFRSEWNVGEAASHLIFPLRGFAASARGEFDLWDQLVGDRLPAGPPTERIAAVNRLFIPAEPRRTASEAAAAIKAGVEDFLAATSGRGSDERMPTPWYGETASLSIGEATCLLLGEQTMHGYDIARASGRRWPIARRDGELILRAVHAMMPKMARPETLGNTKVTYRVHTGGKGDFVARCAGGTIVVEHPNGQRIDCHLFTDPVTFLLIGYGRISQWRAIGRAKIFAFGRKPWQGLRFVRYVSHP